MWRSRRVLVLPLLGFASGIPLLLTAETLGAWLTDAELSLETIGIASLVGLPYTFKWAWAPLVDRYAFPLLGRRRGWLFVLQIALVAAIVLLGQTDPIATPAWLAIAAVVVAFLSATHDIACDAFVADSLHPDERAAGSGLYVAGYRAAMIVTGVVALALADYLPWSAIYAMCAAGMGLGVIATLLAEEPPLAPAGTPDRSDDRPEAPSASQVAAAAPPRTFADAVREPLRRLFRQEHIAIVLAFVALYRFGDYLAQVALVKFLKSGAGFSFTTIATQYKLLGLGAVAIGGALAGVLVPRIGLRRALVVFGVFQAAANLGYVALAHAPSSGLLVVVGLVDQLANALGAAAFVAYLMTRCEPAVSATQFAVLTALSSVGGRVFGVVGGPIQDAVGWGGLWAFTAAIAIPALVLAARIPMDDVRIRGGEPAPARPSRSSSRTRGSRDPS